MPATAASPALRALLEHVVDYAGLFPPAAYTMRDAVAEYGVKRASPEAWMLGRFVVPVHRLDELAAERTALEGAEQNAWPLSVLVSADPVGDAEALRVVARREPRRLVVEAVELRAATVEAVEWALGQLAPALERYVELSLEREADIPPLLEALSRHGARAKVRTGGVTADAFPSPSALAHFIAECARVGVPFKATAGLHHPLRAEQRLTYGPDAPSATMFGFLNVFIAAALARAGAGENELVQMLEEREPSAFVFTGTNLRWRDHVLDESQLHATRRELASSFGSCSFAEPVEDLRRLALL